MIIDGLIEPCEEVCPHGIRCDLIGRPKRHIEHSGYDWELGLVHDWPHFRPDLCMTASAILMPARNIIDVELP